MNAVVLHSSSTLIAQAGAGTRHLSQPVRAAPVDPEPLAHTSSSHPPAPHPQDSSSTCTLGLPPPPPAHTKPSHPTSHTAQFSTSRDSPSAHACCPARAAVTWCAPGSLWPVPISPGWPWHGAPQEPQLAPALALSTQGPPTGWP